MSGLGITSMHLGDATFYRADDTSVVWVDADGEAPLPNPGGGSRDAALLIQIGVDGQFTTVHGQGGDRNVIAKAISELQFLLEALDATYLAGQARGTCLDHGDWGRCTLDDEHDGEHAFPTQQQYEATQRLI